MKIHEWKNRELSRLLMEKFNISENGFPDATSEEDEDGDLEEGIASELGHIALDIAGFVPVIGDAADLTNAVWYVGEAEKHKNNGNGYEAFFAYLFAALSVVSLAGSVAPVIGDLVPKTAKYSAQIARFAKFAKTGGSEAKALRLKLQQDKVKIDGIINVASGKDGRLSGAAAYMIAALNMFSAGKTPNPGDGPEELENEANVGGEEGAETVVNLGSEEGEEDPPTIAELKNYIMNIVHNS